MGRDRRLLGKISLVERRVRDNVLRRLHHLDGAEERQEIEQEFTSVTYDLIKLRAQDFQSTATIHPSEVGECMLRVAFGLRGFERHRPVNPSPRLILAFEVGTAIHKILQGRYDQFGSIVTFENEVEISPATSEVAERYSITGHSDGVFREPVSSFGLGLEIKSMSGKRFAALMLSEHYKNQATLYMKCLGLVYMMFVFVDKNASNIVSKLFDYDEERWKRLVEKMDEVLVRVVAGQEVGRSVNRTVCHTMCNFYKYCRPEV